MADEKPTSPMTHAMGSGDTIAENPDPDRMVLGKKYDDDIANALEQRNRYSKLADQMQRERDEALKEINRLLDGSEVGRLRHYLERIAGNASSRHNVKNPAELPLLLASIEKKTEAALAPPVHDPKA